MAFSTKLVLVCVIALASLCTAFDPRFVNQTHHSPSLLQWNSSIDLIDTKVANLKRVFICSLSDVQLLLPLPRHSTNLTLNMKTLHNESVSTVTFTKISTFFATKMSIALPNVHLKIFDTHADPQLLYLYVRSPGFAIWNLVIDGTVQIPASQISISSELVAPITPLATFIHTNSANVSSTVYFSLPLDADLPDGKDRCLTVDTFIYGAKFDVWYALEAWASSNRSMKVHSNSGAFCLRKELFAQGLGPIQVTFQLTNLDYLQSRAPHWKQLLFTVISFLSNQNPLSGRISTPVKEHASEWARSGSDYPWLYYNPAVFQYKVTSNSSKAIHICDMLANCYQMEEVVNGTVAKDGSKQYTVPEKVHRQLKYTPVVRMLTDDSKAKLETQYFSGTEEVVSRIQSHLNATGISTKIQPLLPEGFRVSYVTKTTIKSPSSGHAADILSLPMHLLDQRAQHFYVTLNCAQSNLLLESIILQFSSGSTLNHTKFNFSLPLGKMFKFLTADFFKPKPHQLPTSEAHLTHFQIVYRALGDQKMTHEGSPVDLAVSLEVNTMDVLTDAMADTGRDDLVKFDTFVGQADYHVSETDRVTVHLNASNPNVFLMSNWIPANPIPATDSWYAAQGHIRLSHRSADGNSSVDPAKDLRVRKYIWGLKEKYVVEKEINMGYRHGEYVDDKIWETRELLNDRFRVGYLISLGDGAGAAGVHADFEWNFQEMPLAWPSSPLCQGPTYGDVICQVERYTCPEHYFKLTQDTGNCQMVVPPLY